MEKSKDFNKDFIDVLERFTWEFDSLYQEWVIFTSNDIETLENLTKQINDTIYSIKFDKARKENNKPLIDNNWINADRS